MKLSVWTAFVNLTELNGSEHYTQGSEHYTQRSGPCGESRVIQRLGR